MELNAVNSERKQASRWSPLLGVTLLAACQQGSNPDSPAAAGPTGSQATTAQAEAQPQGTVTISSFPGPGTGPALGAAGTPPLPGGLTADQLPAFLSGAGAERGGTARLAAGTTWANHGGPRPPSRPVPAAVEAKALTLVDVAAAAGLEHRAELYRPLPSTMLGVMSGGAAFLDFDKDGWSDVLLADWMPVLFRNLGKGRFTRIEGAFADVPRAMYHAVAVGDYDCDGYPDVFINAYRGGVLLHNEAGRGFKNVTDAAGIPAQPWGSAASFADLDRDGRPDLIVGNYLQYDYEKALVCQTDGVPHDCGPQFYKGEQSRVYRNLGDRFEDVTASWGMDDSTGKTLGIVARDLDGDGQLEVVFANDMAPGDLFVAQKPRSSSMDAGSPRFENWGITSGVAYDANGRFHAGMGIDAGDYDRDGRLDLVVTAFYQEGASVYRNTGTHLYRDLAYSNGAGAATWPYVGWGVRVVDLDNDGWLDMLVANGHILDSAPKVTPGSTFKEPLVLLYNDHGTFHDMSSRLTGSAARPMLGRGVASADYDHDGRIDLLVVDAMGDVLLLHNETEPVGHWASIRLQARNHCEPVGAWVKATVGEQTRVESYHVDGSFFSSSEPWLPFGLGDAGRIDTLQVRWPSGQLEQFGPVLAGSRTVLTEGTGQVVSDHGEGQKPATGAGR